MEDEKPKAIDIFVIAVWILIALAIIFSLFDVSKIPNAQLFVQLLAACITGGSVYFASQAVRIANEGLNRARAERKEELLHKKPYFTYLKGEMGESEDEEHLDYIEVSFKNVGVHPAGNMVVRAVVLVEGAYESWTQELSMEYVNDVASGFNLEFNLGGLSLSLDEESHYIMFELKYIDALTEEDFEQKFYLGWVGFHENRKGRVYPISKGIFLRIEKWFRPVSVP